MRYKPPEFEHLRDMASIDVGRLTEDEARAMLEKIRWPDGMVCPQCESKNVTRIKAKSNKVRDGLIQCNSCRKQFTVTVGTVMQGSHITLRQWVQAFYSICSHKKGVSALQLQRNLGLRSYRSAWHLAHRIRKAMETDPMASALKGIVEVDETYVGGKPRKSTKKSKVSKRGRGTKKTPVLAMVERKGKARARKVERVSAKELKKAIKDNVSKNSVIMTDDFKSYQGLKNDFEGGHGVVKHSRGEYVRGDIHTNTGESFFALLKRGVHGTFHHVSKEHLDRYCDEFSFRWDHRDVSDGLRTEKAIKDMVGKSLSYRELVGK
jgi:transposase-like protein